MSIQKKIQMRVQMSDEDLYLTFDPRYPINSDVHLTLNPSYPRISGVHLTSDPLFLYVFILQIRSTKLVVLFLKISFIFIYFEKNGIVIELTFNKKN